MERADRALHDRGRRRLCCRTSGCLLPLLPLHSHLVGLFVEALRTHHAMDVVLSALLSEHGQHLQRVLVAGLLHVDPDPDRLGEPAARERGPPRVVQRHRRRYGRTRRHPLPAQRAGPARPARRRRRRQPRRVRSPAARCRPIGGAHLRVSRSRTEARRRTRGKPRHSAVHPRAAKHGGDCRHLRCARGAACCCISAHHTGSVGPQRD
jgi:hypothetical protein